MEKLLNPNNQFLWLMTKLVIFDLDQTLVDVFRAHDKAYHKTFKEIFGLEACYKNIDYAGKRIPALIEEYALKEGVPKPVIDMNIDEAVRVYELNFRMALKNVREHVLPGIPKLLFALKQKKYKLAIITGDLKALAQLILEESGLKKFFQTIITAEDAKNKTEMAKKAVRRAGKVSEVVIVGDSVRETMAGKQVGAKTIGVLTGEHSKKQHEKAGTEYIFKDLSNTKKVLEAIG